MKIKPAIIMSLGLMMTMTACDRLDNIRMTLDYWRFERRERAFEADFDRIAKDAQGVYQLDYAITDEFLPAVLSIRSDCRAMDDGRFDMSPLLHRNGVEPTAIASAIFDPAGRTVTIIDTGPNVAIVEEAILRPMRPHRYRAIKKRVPPKP